MPSVRSPHCPRTCTWTLWAETHLITLVPSECKPPFPEAYQVWAAVSTVLVFSHEPCFPLTQWRWIVEQPELSFSSSLFYFIAWFPPWTAVFFNICTYVSFLLFYLQSLLLSFLLFFFVCQKIPPEFIWKTYGLHLEHLKKNFQTINFEVRAK